MEYAQHNTLGRAKMALPPMAGRAVRGGAGAGRGVAPRGAHLAALAEGLAERRSALPCVVPIEWARPLN